MNLNTSLEWAANARVRAAMVAVIAIVESINPRKSMIPSAVAGHRACPGVKGVEGAKRDLGPCR